MALPTTVTLTFTQYEFLVKMAQAYERIGNSAGLSPTVDEVRKQVDLANSITRYELLVRWQDLGGKQPSRIEIGKGWPPQQTGLLVMDRPILRSDVEAYVGGYASNPVDIAVTKDVRGVVGWTLLPDWNFDANK